MLNPEDSESSEEFSPDVVTRLKPDVAYDPNATCPAGTNPSKSVRQMEYCFRRWLAIRSSLLYPIDKAVILLGEGGQGTTVFMAVIKNILGTKNVSEVHLRSICSDKFASAELYGMIANFAGDIESRQAHERRRFQASYR